MDVVLRISIFTVFLFFFTIIKAQQGSVDWVVDIGGDLTDEANAMCIDEYENVFVTGFFQGEIVVSGVKYSSHGDTDIFLAKIDKYGSVQWFKQAGGNTCRKNIATEMGNSIALDKYGNVLVCGIFSGQAFFGDTTIVSNGSDDAFVSKWSVDGKLLWVKKFGNEGCNIAQQLVVDDDQIYISGVSSGSFLNDISLINIPLSFLIKLDNKGELLWFVEHETSIMALNTMLLIHKKHIYWGSHTVEVTKTKQTFTSNNSYQLILSQLDKNDGQAIFSKTFFRNPSALKYKLFFNSDSLFILDYGASQIYKIVELNQSISSDDKFSDRNEKYNISIDETSLNRMFISDSLRLLDVITKSDKSEDYYLTANRNHEIYFQKDLIYRKLVSSFFDINIKSVSIVNGQYIYLLANYSDNVYIDETVGLFSESRNSVLVRYSVNKNEISNNNSPEMDDPNIVNVYPNPSNNGIYYLNTMTKNLRIKKIIVENSLSEIVYVNKSEYLPDMIDISNHSSGVYSLIIEFENYIFNKRLVLTK